MFNLTSELLIACQVNHAKDSAKKYEVIDHLNFYHAELHIETQRRTSTRILSAPWFIQVGLCDGILNIDKSVLNVALKKSVYTP
jgi:hypothetical protein